MMTIDLERFITCPHCESVYTFDRYTELRPEPGSVLKRRCGASERPFRCGYLISQDVPKATFVRACLLVAARARQLPVRSDERLSQLEHALDILLLAMTAQTE